MRIIIIKKGARVYCHLLTKCVNSWGTGTTIVVNRVITTESNNLALRKILGSSTHRGFIGGNAVPRSSSSYILILLL